MSVSDVVLNIGSAKQLFLDDYVIDDMQETRRQLHRPNRYEGNPIIDADQLWERKGAGVNLSGGTVFFDEEEKIFKMWYRTTDKPPKSMEHWKGSQDDLMPEGAYKCGYATSTNGIDWEKPILGQVETFGSTRNNFIPPGAGGKGHIRRPNIIKDYVDDNDSRRYKMIYMDEMSGEYQMLVGYSSDGVRWNMGEIKPISFERPILPHGTIFGWDQKMGKWVYFHRKGGYDPKYFIPADVDGRRVRTEFGSFVRSTSDDFETWGNTVDIVSKDPYWDPPNWDPGSHLGVLAAIQYTDDMYVGVMDVSITNYVEDAPPELWETVYMWDHPRHSTELVISRDGDKWHRVSPHWEYLRPGMWGDWDSYAVAVNKPIVVNDEIFIYYSGTTLPDKHNLPNHPFFDEFEKEGGPSTNAMAIGLAKMRLDGFVSIDGYRPDGTWTTKVMVFKGAHLEVNVRAPRQVYGPDLGSWGSLKVEILDSDGSPLPGYTVGECDPFSGDELRHSVTWGGNQDVGRLSGQPIRLKFYQRNAAVYAFQFIDAKYTAPDLNLQGPGNKGRP